MCCDLQVDVNGENIFLVDKKILVSFSARLSKMFGRFRSRRKNLKVIFHDFPGGAEGFELICRFCYSNGRINITPSNVFILHCAANFMEMNRDKAGVLNLVKKTESYLKSIDYWTWSEFIPGLKQCQDLFPVMNSSRMFHDFLTCVVRNLTPPSVASPCTSSSASSSFGYSGEISANSSKISKSETVWWFLDLVFLNIELFALLVKTMILQNLDQPTICSFLFHYQKSRFFLCASPAEKCKTMETTINLLSLLDGNFVSSRGLFNAFGMGLSLKMRSRENAKLESLIGSRLDQATINDLLVPSPHKKKYAYDINLILRLTKEFLLQSRFGLFPTRLKKVAALIDLFMAEVAPDPWLKPSKFVALATALPDFARDSHDKMYRATDMYIEVHCGLSEEKEIQIYSVVNLNKLSEVALEKLVQNTKFPLKLHALFFPQYKTNSFLRHENLKNRNEFTDQEAENIFRYAENIDFPATYEKMINTSFPDSRCRSRVSKAKSLSGQCH